MSTTTATETPIPMGTNEEVTTPTPEAKPTPTKAQPTTPPATKPQQGVTADQVMVTAKAVAANPTVRKSVRMVVAAALIGLALVGGIALWGGAVRISGTTVHVASLGYESQLVTMVNQEREKNAKLQKDLEVAQRSFWSKLKFW